MAPKLIFTITPGRSGTAYLARLLGAIPGVSAYHEPGHAGGAKRSANRP